MAEIETYLKQISQCRGVEGIVIFTIDGLPIRSSLDEELTVLFAQTFSMLAKKAAALVTALDAGDEPRLLRYRTRNHEILISFDKNFILLTLQAPQVEVM